MIYTPEFAPYQPKRACRVCLLWPPTFIVNPDYTPRRAA